MALVDRDVFLRKYVIGVLAALNGKILTSEGLSTLADDITQAVIEGDNLWQQEHCNEQIIEMASRYENEDVPQ